jgi:uncharacterized protein (TIGR02996 family)
MNEDETFIRAIVDTRGDETARLVYADWLDDRDDPRGAYLRAEAEWARTGKKEKALRALAASLDPVWVARVSRPPVGICADKIVMSTNHDPATPADLDAAEEQLTFPLPPELRALLLNWNGARPAVGQPACPLRFRYGLTEVEQFLPVLTRGKKRRTDYEEMWDLVEATETLCDPNFAPHTATGAHLLSDYVPLADGGDLGTYLMGVRGDVRGKIGFFFDLTHNFGDPDHLGVVFPSLGALLASMIAEAPEWYRHTRNGDRAALIAWLDAGGDINTRHPESGESLLYTAMCMHDLSLVRELLARGVKVDRNSRELAGILDFASGRKIRDAISAAEPPKKKGKK